MQTGSVHFFQIWACATKRRDFFRNWMFISKYIYERVNVRTWERELHPQHVSAALRCQKVLNCFYWQESQKKKSDQSVFRIKQVLQRHHRKKDGLHSRRHLKDWKILRNTNEFASPSVIGFNTFCVLFTVTSVSWPKVYKLHESPIFLEYPRDTKHFWCGQKPSFFFFFNFKT